MRIGRVPLVLTLALSAAACRTANVSTGAPTSTAPTAPPAPIAAGSKELPAGTPLKVTLQDALSTKESKVGQDVRATLSEPVTDTSGKTLVPAGALLTGTVTELQPSPHAGEPAAIRVNFDELKIGNRGEPVATEITETKPQVEENYGRAKAGAAIGAAGGAVLGAVIGHSIGGALAGGVLGAGAGTAISLGTGDVQAKLPAGTPMTLRLTQSAPVP